MVFFDLIAAIDSENGLGKNGNLAWKLKTDLKFFKQLTQSKNPLNILNNFGFQINPKSESLLKNLFSPQNSEQLNSVIMGRKTWDSLPSFAQPLPQRKNIILSQNLNNKTLVAKNLNEAMSLSEPQKFTYVIGGSQVYQQAIKHPQCRLIYLTQIKKSFDCDCFFPAFKDSFSLLAKSPTLKEGSLEFCFSLFGKTI